MFKYSLFVSLRCSKRVAVANELVVRPSLLLLDEPTSGLDSTTSMALMETLKQLANRGHSIAAVIHQPRTTIFQALDHLLLLSKGRVIYDGPPSAARQYLEGCSTVSPLPPETGIGTFPRYLSSPSLSNAYNLNVLAHTYSLLL